jgi:hypothetical protein
VATTIDIALPDELTAALTPPDCLDLRLPKPSMPQLKLPTGMTLKGLADVTRGIPTDCSMNFSIMLQLAPMMASMECLLKVLKFLGAIIKSAKKGDVFSLLPDIVQGAEDLMPCVLMATPAGLFCFIKDLLLLIARLLRCTLTALKSIVDIMGGLKLDIATALQEGNDEQLAALQCAQENAGIAADSTMRSLEPIMVLLQLADPFLEIAGVSLDVTIPSGVSSDDLEAMQNLVQTLTSVVSAIETVAQGIPC